MARWPMRLGPYRIERRIASGGMAEVFVAHREAAHGFLRRVALKTILPQYASDPEFVAMFADEARLVARLEHPAIAQVFDFGEADGALFLAMEYVDGTSLSRLLRAVSATRDPSSIPLATILHVGIEVARALAYAHHARDPHGTPLGIVHRDVSPANILLGRRGEVKLVDFGIARARGAAHRTDEGLVRGKLGYMSPEQVQGHELDARSDVFTLAAVLAELCLREPLFGTGEDLSILMRIRNADVGSLDRLAGLEVRDALERAPSPAPADLVRVLRAALAARPEERIEASHFADALEAIVRRRRLEGRGARETARLLHRLGVLTVDPADVEAREPGARPTSLIAAAEPPASSTVRPEPLGTRELLASLALDPPSQYELVTPAGRSIGPLSYAELVRRLVAGEVDPSLAVRREGLEGEPPELRRYLGSKALGWAEVDEPRVREQGDVTPGRLLALALRCATTRATGLLEVVEGGDGARARPSRRKRVFFVDGKPEFVASNDPRELLGEFLVESGLVTRMEIELALAVLDRYEGRLADALVDLGVVRPIAITNAIERQVRARYLEVFRWRSGTFSFTEGLRAGEEVVPLARGPLELLYDAASGLDATLAESAISPLSEHVVTRVLTPPAPLAVFGVPRAWERAILGVDGSTPLVRLVMRAREEHGLELDDAYRAYHFGLSCSFLRAVASRASTHRA